MKLDEPDAILTSDTSVIALHCHVSGLPAAFLRTLPSQLSADQRRARIHGDAVGTDEDEGDTAAYRDLSFVSRNGYFWIGSGSSA